MEENNVSSVFDELAVEQPFFEYATAGQRFANLLIDSLVCYLFNTLVTFIVAYTMVISGKDLEEVKELFKNTWFLLALGLLGDIVIYTFIEGITKGRTLGKVITGTQAVNYDLGAITWKQAFIRTLSRLIPFEPFSMFNGVPWHDSFSKTIVIKKRRQF